METMEETDVFVSPNGDENVLYELYVDTNNHNKLEEEDEQLFEESFEEELSVDSGSEVDEHESPSLEELRQFAYDDEEKLDEEKFDEEKFGEGEALLNDGHDYVWGDDLTTFRGERAVFTEEAGPKVEGTDPLELFTQIWDLPIMEMMVQETNKYAQSTIDTAVEENTLSPTSSLNAWVETSVEEIYRLMAIMMITSICVRHFMDEYWTTSIMGMPAFLQHKLMTLQRFRLLIELLHFVDNDYILPTVHGEERKLFKIVSVLDYLNSKFQAIYTPRQELSFDESLLTWKGRLNRVECIRSKEARFVIKGYELCEAATGYCLKTVLYTSKTSSTHAVSGFTSSDAKIVLNLMKGYLGKGYTLFMYSFYNSVSLARFLKSKITDVVGTLNRRCIGTPQVIKEIDEKRVSRRRPIYMHCGDVAVTSWKDVKLVTILSTYHKNETLRQRAGRDCAKPVVVHDYDKHMADVDLLDRKFSMYGVLERKRGLKWYIKIFRRLLNVSILNAYVIHCANAEVSQQTKMSYNQFRYALADQLILRYGANEVPGQHTDGVRSARLDRSLGHFPEEREVEGERTSNRQKKYKEGCCVRCAAKTIRKTSTVICIVCEVFLCIGECWCEYHSLDNL